MEITEMVERGGEPSVIGRPNNHLRTLGCRKKQKNLTGAEERTVFVPILLSCV